MSDSEADGNIVLPVRECLERPLWSISLQVDIFAFAMLLYELTTGVRPFDEIENVSEINRLVIRGERPRVLDYNAEPTFPSLTELMYDCWRQAAADRPDAKQVRFGRGRGE